jgi:hypothetical protein
MVQGRITWISPCTASFRFRFAKGGRWEFRAEFFNFFNRPEFGMPGMTLNLAQTGQIAATSIPNRQVQFALKLLW